MTTDAHELRGLRALVTGGTKGIGQAIAARLRESGATVLTTARTAPDDSSGSISSPLMSRQPMAAGRSSTLCTADSAASMSSYTSSVDRLLRRAGLPCSTTAKGNGRLM